MDMCVDQAGYDDQAFCVDFIICLDCSGFTDFLDFAIFKQNVYCVQLFADKDLR